MDQIWILRDDGALCMDGYPIRITRDKPEIAPFWLGSDFHGKTLPYFTLESAKLSAKRLADEIDEFTPKETAK